MDWSSDDFQEDIGGNENGQMGSGDANNVLVKVLRA